MTTAEEAGRWFAALRRGIMSIEERAAYEAWLTRSANRDAMMSIQNLWSLLDGTSRPAALTRHARKAILSAIFASSLVIAAISTVGDSHFWTTLDWTDR